ncbi:hypothetical protein PLICRDRAFT_180237 [Plicaturopsis crispa FD-325 SS-3]|uniref:DUF6534 domain-containing protein n=1 Tax=Plicaturopsis crispa FD-325 SS-3 TaxID=944288 RepID=A0A0C9SWD2_PLICR|nr:hypothetical protein PLICRDRAFT_180237 [Plicaturopsis crispa FD-325 SS-3]
MSDPAAPPPIVGEQLYVLIAPFFIGSIINWLLLGTLTVQLYIYHSAQAKDQLIIKVLVYGVYALDVLQTIFATIASWDYLVKGWGNELVLAEAPWSSSALTICSPIIALIVMLFFGWRIWRLKNNIISHAVVVLIVLIAFMQCISGVVSSILFLVNPTREELLKIQSGFTVWLAGSFVADVLIAGSLIVILRELRAKSPFAATDNLVTRMMAHTVQTGLVTAVAAGLEMILFLAFKTNNLHGVLAYILGKLYSNVLLANLNARTRMLRISDSSSSTSGSGDAYRLGHRHNPSGGAQTPNHPRMVERAKFDEPAVLDIASTPEDDYGSMAGLKRGDAQGTYSPV